MSYQSFSSDANVTITDNGDADGTHGGLIVGIGLQWSSNLNKIPTLEGPKSIPDIPKGQIIVNLLVLPSGTATAAAASCPMYDISGTASVDLNGTAYQNCYHTGGGIRMQDFGEGVQGMILIKRYSVFGQATTG